MDLIETVLDLSCECFERLNTGENDMISKEAAKQLKLDPKHLRAILRSIGKGSKGKSYDLKAGDISAVEKHLASEPAPMKKADKK